MNTYKTSARAAGVLYIMGTVSGILSVVFTSSLLDASDVLAEIAANDTQMIAGALCVLVMGLSLALIPLAVYPVLKRHNPLLAHGYLLFRGALEMVTYIVTVVSWLVLVPISQEYIKAADADYFDTFGTLLVEASDQAATLTEIIFPIGALMFYIVLYRARLVPRWISVWGLVAVAFYIPAALLDLFDVLDPMSISLTLLFMPMAFQEMVMAIWLIVKGFNAAEREVNT